MTYSNGKLTIEKNPLDADKDITIYYSIDGNYFRPETYTDVYQEPISVSLSQKVCCYAISSEGNISYTNMYVVQADNSTQCARPTIYYQNGQLIFKSETEDVEFISEIQDIDEYGRDFF